MERALDLAERGLGCTFPNPAVGAVLVRGGRIVGSGWHHRAGVPHAEIEALRAAGTRARGAELFVTLEPCAHHGRTPPCVDALLPLKLRRVVVGAVDPNPRVRGRSIRRVRAAGVPVVLGVGKERAEGMLEGFRSLVTRGRPQITLKLATSLDGRIAAAGGESRWITGAPARQVAHGLRHVVDAVLVGAETLRRDDPRLTCRLPGGHDPIRIVVWGGRSRLPVDARLFRPGGPPTWLVVPDGATSTRIRAVERRGVEVVRAPARAGRVAFDDVAHALGRRGLTSVLIEGGGRVAAAALQAGVVDRLIVFVAPRLLGGRGVPAIGDLPIRRVADALALADLSVARIGRDLVVEASVRPSHRFASRHPAR